MRYIHWNFKLKERAWPEIGRKENNCSRQVPSTLTAHLTKGLNFRFVIEEERNRRTRFFLRTLAVTSRVGNKFLCIWALRRLLKVIQSYLCYNESFDN